MRGGGAQTGNTKATCLACGGWGNVSCLRVGIRLCVFVALLWMSVALQVKYDVNDSYCRTYSGGCER